MQFFIEVSTKYTFNQKSFVLTSYLELGLLEANLMPGQLRHVRPVSAVWSPSKGHF